MKAYDGGSFIDGVVKANVMINQMKYPNFAGSGTVATGWSTYVGSGTPTGSRSVAGGVQTITATAIIGGNRRFGVANIGSNRPTALYVEAGQMIYVACDIDTTGLAAGTTFGLYIEPTEATGGAIAFPEVTISSTSATRAELRWAVPAAKIITNTTVYFWIKSSIDWSGTSVVKVSNMILLKHSVYDAAFTYPYFDGNTTDCVWEGTASASRSLKPDWRTYNIKRWDGAAWVPA